jgi:Putative zinc-finger
VRQDASGCRDITILLGVYVLGGLRGHQETRVRTHLARCARCRGEYEELAEVPALLDMLTSEEAVAAARLSDQAGALGGKTGEPTDDKAGTPADVTELPRRLPLRRARSDGRTRVKRLPTR